MKIVKPSHEILVAESPYKHIEKIGRICYKSEDSITETSAEPFVQRLFNSGHHAMLEHFRFILEMNDFYYTVLKNIDNNKYMTFTDYSRKIMSVSARGLNDIYKRCRRNNGNSIDTKILALKAVVKSIIEKYGCASLFDNELYDNDDRIMPNNQLIRIIDNFDDLTDTEYDKHAWYSVHFVCDRGVTHEMVRHRDASFAQESTRYCNYSKGKYGNEITVIEPLFWDAGTPKYSLWRLACEHSEGIYRDLIKYGATPQEARSVLPNSLKTEIVITAQIYEWKHIFNLRVLGTTGAPHPQMKEVMEPVFNEMTEGGYIR